MSDGAWENQSFRHMVDDDKEPGLDYRDLQRWDKWFAWERRRNNRCCFTNRHEQPDGHVVYFKALRSQVTRRFRGTPEELARYYIRSGQGRTPKGRHLSLTCR
jgi:hypothetical protein